LNSLGVPVTKTGKDSLYRNQNKNDRYLWQPRGKCWQKENAKPAQGGGRIPVSASPMAVSADRCLSDKDV